MVAVSAFSLLSAATSLIGLASAHPGHDIRAEAAERAAGLAALEFRSLDHCASQLKAREPQMIARRKAGVERLRAKRSIKKRDIENVLATDHYSNKTVNVESPYEDIFTGNASCLLQSETTEGPYYVSGEEVRVDITEGEAGVPWTVDIQIIDTITCEAMPNVALEIWHCNATGVYGGIVAGGNGNQADATNINKTALRGIQISGEEGIVQFDSIFPGHYTGRTAHAHIMTHMNSEVNTANNTLIGGTISHVGQIFYDQDLINEVELTPAYVTNTQQLTTNAQDGIMAQEAETSDPVINYVYVGTTVEDGIFSWITVGIDPRISKNVSAAAYVDENGGHANPNAGGGPGGPGGPRPTGAPPVRLV